MEQRKEDSCWVGFDLGGTKMFASVFDGKFRALGKKRKKTKGHEGSDSGVDRIVRTINEALEEAKVTPDRIAGIGIGCPGPLDLDKGIIVDAPNLGWKNVRIKDALEKQFGCRVLIANDVDAGVYGEYRFGAGKSQRCVLGVFPGTGIGGGCVYEGKIFRGSRSSCMEIGHVQVAPDGPRCGCGRYGCLEAVASRLAISAAAAQAAFRGQAPHLLELVGTDLGNIRSGTLADAIKAGDKVIEEIVRQAARQLGAAVGGFVNVLAPDAIVLGGGLVEAMPDLYLSEVKKSVQEHVLPSSVMSFRVVPAELGDDACVMGAAAWVESSANSAAK